MCMIDEPKTEIHFHQTTTLTPELYIAGLTDFGPGRSKTMPRLVEIGSNQRGSCASARPRLNTWVVVFLICISLIAVFAMELHLRKVEHRSLSLLRDDCFATAGVVARQRPASVSMLRTSRSVLISRAIQGQARLQFALFENNTLLFAPRIG